MQKLKNEFKFLNTPKFSYEYKDEVNVLGRKLVHIGEGIYIFERPFVSNEFSLDQFKEKLKDYKDISFIRFYKDSYGFTHSKKNEEKWIIPFAISATHRRHSRYMWNDDDRVMRYIAEFSIPDPMKCIIDHITENYLKPDKEYDISRAEEIYYDKGKYLDEIGLEERPGPVDGECTHLLDFKYDTDDGRYVLVNGFVGRKILEGIYYFDDTISLAEGESYLDWTEKVDRLRSSDLEHCDFDENIAFIGEQIWDGASIMIYNGSSIYYMAFDDKAIDVLCRLYKSLSGYEMRVMKKDAVAVKREPLAIDESFLDGIKRIKNNRRPIKIPEGACKLIEGMGFHDLDVRYKVRLFDDVEEDIVQVVIDNENGEDGHPLPCLHFLTNFC